MKQKKSAEDYLKTIYVLSKGKEVLYNLPEGMAVGAVYAGWLSG